MSRLPVMIGVLFAALVAGIIVAASGGNARIAGVLAAAAAAFAICLAIFGVVRRLTRVGSGPRSSAAETAAMLGLRYREKGEKSFHCRFGKLPAIPRSGSVKHVMEGDVDGRPLTAFEHLYYVNTGQAVVPVYHTVYLTPAGAWPMITITRRRGLRRFLEALGMRKGVQLEDERFNRNCLASDESEDIAIAVLGPEMQAFIAARPDIMWRIGEGHAAMIYNGRLRADRVEASLARLRQFWELMPAELR